MENKTELTRFLLVYVSPSLFPSLFSVGSQVKVESLKFQGICWNGWDSRIALLTVLPFGVGEFPCHITRKGAVS